MTISLQRDMHPTKCYLKLSFVTAAGEVVGFLLLEKKEHTSGAARCSLRGMRIAESRRGQGLSTLCIAIWLKLCRALDLEPTTNRIDKPLVCLALHKFGFTVAREQACGKEGRKRGVEVMLRSVAGGTGGEAAGVGKGGAEPVLALFSPTNKSLANDFSEQELRSQGLVLGAVEREMHPAQATPLHQSTQADARATPAEGGGGGGRGGTPARAAYSSPAFICKAAFDAPADLGQLEQRVLDCLSARGGGALELRAPVGILRLAFVVSEQPP